ncbi:hypothetical protein PENSPDRAFT_756975 [Peniophora sp. CONT]|nr:hypothetical protein PENSPDRAFT_756975 [Peniophora sp. CONT]
MSALPESEYVQSLREGPTAALEHLSSLYRSRAPGLISGTDKVFSYARDLLVYIIASANGSNTTDIIAQAMDAELRRACFESEILLVFADMMADQDFLRHYSVRLIPSVFSLSISRCTLILLRAWLHEIFESRTLMSTESASCFFDKLELACSNFWDKRSQIDNLHDRNMGVIFAELQGIFFTVTAIRSRLSDSNATVVVPPVMVKTAVLFWVHSHTNIIGAEDEHFRRLYTGSCEKTMSLLLTTFHNRRRKAITNRDGSTSPSIDEDALTEILQEIGAGPLLRSILNALKFSRFMGGFPRLRDCLVACGELYFNPGDSSFKEVYLQLPMLQAISTAVLRPNMPALMNASDPVAGKPALEAYRCAWTHMKIIGSACRSGSISPSLITSESTWRMMLESVTVVLDLGMEIYTRQDDSQMVDFLPYLQSFEDTLLEGLSIWIDGLHGSTSGQGGFPKSIIEGLVDDRMEGASMWYGFIRTTRGRFPGGEVNLPAIAKLLDAWIRFGTVLGFDERKERDRLAVRTCSWRACPYSLMPASKPLMVCKGCQENRYCSSTCQRSDWKEGGHRARCRRLKT